MFVTCTFCHFFHLFVNQYYLLSFILMGNMFVIWVCFIWRFYNLIVEDFFQRHPMSKRKLKELFLHTPSHVDARSTTWDPGGLNLLSWLLLWSEFYVDLFCLKNNSVWFVVDWLFVYKTRHKLLCYNPKKVAMLLVSYSWVKVIE